MRSRIPIAKKLLVMVLTTSTVLSTVLTIVQMAFQYKEKRSQQNGVISGIETSLLPSVGQRMWDYDVAAIQDQLRGMLQGARHPSERPQLDVLRVTKSDDELTDVIECIRAHDLLLYQLQDLQKAKIENQEKAVEESDEALKQERMRAEMSARVALLAEMASGIAHEINNPLAIISGYVSLAKRECAKPTVDPANIVSNMDKASATIQRFTRIITGLRAFARHARHGLLWPRLLSRRS